jgi:hypothetical protein
MATLTRDNQGRFAVNKAGKAVQLACDTLQTLSRYYKQGDKTCAIKLLNSPVLRPIVVVQCVQGRLLTVEEARQYTSYPCVDVHLITAMKAGKKFEELKRACRVELHTSSDMTAKFAEFIGMLDVSRSRME